MALLVPVEERERCTTFVRGLSDYSNSPGRLAAVRWRFESAIRRPGINPATFATGMGILAMQCFDNMGERACGLMIRNKFIAAQPSRALCRHLDGASAEASIGDIVDSCRVWESHAEDGYDGPDLEFPHTFAPVEEEARPALGKGGWYGREGQPPGSSEIVVRLTLEGECGLGGGGGGALATTMGDARRSLWTPDVQAFPTLGSHSSTKAGRRGRPVSDNEGDMADDDNPRLPVSIPEMGCPTRKIRPAVAGDMTPPQPEDNCSWEAPVGGGPGFFSNNGPTDAGDECIRDSVQCCRECGPG